MLTQHVLPDRLTLCRLTNQSFLDKVVAAFGPNPAQNPYMDCADTARSHGLLKPLAAPVKAAVV